MPTDFHVLLGALQECEWIRALNQESLQYVVETVAAVIYTRPSQIYESSSADVCPFPSFRFDPWTLSPFQVDAIK